MKAKTQSKRYREADKPNGGRHATPSNPDILSGVTAEWDKPVRRQSHRSNTNNTRRWGGSSTTWKPRTSVFYG